MPSPTQKLDLTDLISLICLFRKEKYAFERHLALLTFGLWIIEPNDINFVNQGRLVGAAQIVRSLVQKGKKSALTAQRKFLEQEFSYDLVVSALLSPPVIGPFKDEIEMRTLDLQIPLSIVQTFLQAPATTLHSKRPSLNKAIHFIANGGYGLDQKFAPATIKKQWVAHALAVPFLMAALNQKSRVVGLAPDTSTWFRSTNAILEKTNELKQYFGLAKSLQEQLVAKLDPVSRRRFPFVEFPSQIESFPFELEPFTGDALKLYQSYKAPKY